MEGDQLMDYIAIIHKEGKSDFGVSFPDFAGCVTAGSTLQEARVNAVEALALHVKGMIEDGESLPEPSTLDEVMEDDDFKDGVAFIVGLEMPDKVVRVNITVTESDLKKIDTAAKKNGMNRSSFLVQNALRA
jgi:predicted RNase H-like HicB family nuclease